MIAPENRFIAPWMSMLIPTPLISNGEFVVCGVTIPRAAALSLG